VVRQRNRNHFYQDKETAITNNVLKNFFFSYLTFVQLSAVFIGVQLSAVFIGVQLSAVFIVIILLNRFDFMDQSDNFFNLICNINLKLT
jgi:hypothetical protein